jgi:DNA-binding Lrp family transcriptional regulator
MGIVPACEGQRQGVQYIGGGLIVLDILRMLEQDGRLTPEQIAERTGQSVDEVRSLIAEAEATGVIQKYKAVINWEKAPETEVTYAFIEVKVTPQQEFGFDAIAERIMRFPEVRSLYLLSGSYDLQAVVEGKDLREIANFVTTKLSPLDTVLSTTTHFVLKAYKVDGDILHDGEAPERLPISM